MYQLQATPKALLLALIAVAMVIVVWLVVRPSITRSREGKMLAFVALFILPVLAASFGGANHLQRSKETQFCLSCHVMEPYGRSLRVDDASYVPAAHYQNGRVPREAACYTCHTDYTMYGPLRAKIRGLQHVYAQYIGGVSRPIKLYRPYNNRECLHCHAGARSFEEGAVHSASPEVMAEIKVNKLSCLSSGCHENVHNVEHLNEVKMWEGSEAR